MSALDEAAREHEQAANAVLDLAQEMADRGDKGALFALREGVKEWKRAGQKLIEAQRAEARTTATGAAAPAGERS